MTTYHIDDANDDEPGFIAARPLCVPKTYYELGDGMGGTVMVRGDEALFAVAEELGDGYCDDCELPHDVCACDDAKGYDGEFVDEDEEARWREVCRAYGIPDEFVDRPADFSATLRREERQTWLLPIMAVIPWIVIAIGWFVLTMIDA